MAAPFLYARSDALKRPENEKSIPLTVYGSGIYEPFFASFSITGPPGCPNPVSRPK